MPKCRISMSTNSEALLCRFIFRTQRPLSHHVTSSACRQKSQDSGNVAQQKCQVAEGSNGAVLALTAKGQSTSVVLKSLSSPGLSKCATGYPWQQQLSLPSMSILSQFLKHCKSFCARFGTEEQFKVRNVC
jgi:hypothetical protein